MLLSTYSSHERFISAPKPELPTYHEPAQKCTKHEPANMDTLIALENMAQTSATADSYADVDRWMKRFGYTAAQAEKAIETHFQDLSRIIVSDDHWDMVRTTTDARGHDPESYAHYLMQHASAPSTLQQPSPMRSNTKKRTAEQYLVKIVQGLTAADIQAIAGLLQPQKVVTNDFDDNCSAIVDTSTMAALENSLPQGFFYVPLPAPAAKDLSDISLAPTLGVEATLPQHRICNAPSPLQHEYPVPYFFYGTLAEPIRLSRLLDLEYEPSFRAATISRGKKRRWETIMP